MTKKNPLSIVFVLILVVALVGAVMLVNQNQETRRGAYFSGAKMSMQPQPEAIGKVGEVIPVQLWVQTDKLTGSDQSAKVSSVKTTICLTGDSLRLATDDAMDSVQLNQEALKLLGDATFTNNCLSITALSFGIEPALLKSGAVRIATVKFVGTKEGEGEISYKSELTTVGGYNPEQGAQDASLKVADYTGVKYKVTAGDVTGDKWKKGSCNTTTGKYSCTQAADGTFDSQAGCEDTTGCDVAELKWKKGSCNTGTGKYSCTQAADGTFDSEADCEDTTGCDEDDSQTVWPVLKYQIAFDSVAKNARCAVNWPVQLIVLGNGKTLVFADLKPERQASDYNLSVYQGEVVLEGFDVKDNVAVFLKGSKHLQMKYGVQNQTAAYNKAGGELSLKAEDAPDHVTYDFTGYPMLAGDVFNEVANTPQDGNVNGLDYSLVKKGAETHRTVDEGGYLTLDLDGNCQLNSGDVDVIKKTLKEKQGQLY